MYTLKAKGWIKHLDFILWDCICLTVAFFLANVLRYSRYNMLLNEGYTMLFGIMILLNFVVIIVASTMKDVLRRGYYIEFGRTMAQSVFLLLAVSAYLFLTKTGMEYSRIVIYLTVGIYTILTYIVRIIWKIVLHHTKMLQMESALLIMASEATAPSLIAEINKNGIAQHRIVGIVVHDDQKIGRKISFLNDTENDSQNNQKKEQNMVDIPVVASYHNVVEYVTNHWVDEVLISVNPGEALPDEILNELCAMGVTIHINLNTNTRIGAKQTVDSIGDLFVVSTSLNYMRFHEYLMKRSLDIIGGLFGCIAVGIFYVFLAPRIRRESPGPVFFVQERIGKNGKPFKMYKFRSMYLDAEERKKELLKKNRLETDLMFKMDFDPRVIGNRVDENGKQVTGIGEFIRKYSIDEFPQFYNVLKGDMSLVGTRPPLKSEYEAYSAHHKARLATVPGITGLWQISGRSDILDFEEVVKLDTQYINNWSMGMDFRILLKTIKVVLKKEGSM